jgi:methionyl-tRNA formyltransferase
MNILYIGSSGPLSLTPLQALLDSEHELAAVGIDANRDSFLSDPRVSIIAAENETIEIFARMTGTPVINLYAPLTQCVREISRLQPDIVIVSCFERILPAEILALPKLGCFNLHPSLLPAYRGPVPLFWQFRDGVERTGVSLHRMTSKIDAGPVVAQAAVILPDGVSNMLATSLLAQQGAELILGFLEQLERGNVIERIQNEREASYRGFPHDDDFCVSTDWPARRIYNFMNATSHWGRGYPCEFDGELFTLAQAQSFTDSATAPERPADDTNTLVIRCNPGYLTATRVI